MKVLTQLIDKSEIYNLGNNEPVLHLTNNSKNVKQNSLFFAIKGTKVDGHKFVEDAVSKGAKSVVVQDKKVAQNLKSKYPFINIVLTDNARKTQSEIASKFYDNPSEKLKIFGITGTNGKTTTANLISQYLELHNKNCGIIGTIAYRFKNKIFSAGNTTPDSIEWNYLLKKMKDLGADYVVSEVSSHAVSQYRIHGTKFEGGIFTNLTQDHLDYHLTMENYFQSKMRFFDYIYKTNPDAVFSINVDDKYGRRIYEKFKNKINIISYGKTSSEFKILEINSDIKGVSFKYKYKGKIKKISSSLRGDFNIFNIVASFSLLLKHGIDEEFLIEATSKLKPIRGRFEILEGEDFLVVNDYAHTPDALENILLSLNKIKKKRIIIVFGAGGDRDRTKRPVMGRIAEDLADIVILTSDNPRSEQPEKIIEDICTGIKGKKEIYKIIDRKEAIKKAIEIAEKDDIVLIAGKGHETYQIIGDNIYHFDDLDVAKKYLKSFNKTPL
jgi:UDP-N-acetylmuramoyl-L-alanyl-D-glutamate--2,6-diaminopimelate ligase